MHKRDGSLADFEQGVRKVLFSNSPSKPTLLVNDPEIDMIWVYRNLEALAENNPNLLVDIEFNRNEKWIGAFCKKLDIAIFYQYKDGKGQIYTSGSGECLERVFSVFGEQKGEYRFSEKEGYSENEPITRLSRRLRIDYLDYN